MLIFESRRQIQIIMQSGWYSETALVLGVIFVGVAVILFRNRGGKKNRKDVQYHYTIHEDEK